MEYSLNIINKSKTTEKVLSISYNCYNTYYSGRVHASNEYIKINRKNILNIKNFMVKIQHSLEYQNHIYIISWKRYKE